MANKSGIGQGLLGLLRWLISVVAQSLIAAFIFLVLFFALLQSMFAERPATVPDGAALVVAPRGQLVEQLTERDPLQRLVEENRQPEETLIRDLVRAIRKAEKDDRISALVVIPDRLTGATPAALHYLASVIDEFRQSKKPVYAYGTGYSQSAYMLAAHADEVYMHPLGAVSLFGYGVYPMYLKGAADKLRANVNIFRVGTYKSAVEPLMRENMSDAAREANSALLDVFWDAYLADIAKARGFDVNAYRASYATLSEDLRQHNGDTGELALSQGLVDKLMTRTQWRDYMVGKIGKAAKGLAYKRIGISDYLRALGDEPSRSNKVAVIVARGAIQPGEKLAGTIGADTLARHVRAAREDKSVKAIVLRVDSPGGSVIASEIIRQEIGAARDAGLPVIVSMGGVAASGGYWISTQADQIWAEPTTITGSIGIFGIFITFERTLDEVGIRSDGVGTTPLSGGLGAARPLPDLAKDIIQQSIEHGYDRFLERVASARNMTKEQVDAIGQGRVWAGVTAKELGLVDSLGTIDDAIKAAARLAGIEDYSVKYVEDQPSRTDRLVNALLSRVTAYESPQEAPRSAISKVTADFLRAGQMLDQLNDPDGVYAVCLTCEIR